MSAGKPLIVLVGSLTEREKIKLVGIIQELNEDRKKCRLTVSGTNKGGNKQWQDVESTK